MENLLYAATPLRLSTLTQVMAATSRSRSRIYADIQLGTFPKPIKDGTSTRWIESEIQQWIAQRVAERDGKVA